MALEVKRKFGKFKTPAQIAQFMAKWSIRDRHDVVLDPCTGSGILLYEAIRRLEDLGASGGISKNIYGVDIDPFAIENLANTLKLHGNIFRADFLKVKPAKSIFVSESEAKLPLVDVIICNPPYTRHQQISRYRKEEIAHIIESEAGVKISRLSSIYVHFLIHAAQFLKKDGRMAFLTPSNFLDVNYGVALKRFLVDNFRIASVIVFSEGELLFPRVSTTACITLLERRSNKDHVVKFLRTDLQFNSDELLELLGNGSLLISTDKASIKNVPQLSLDPAKKWNHYFGNHPRRAKGFVPLGKFANVQRGIATGANKFFTLSDDMVEKLKLERRFLRPVLRKTRDAPFYDFTNEDLLKLQMAGKRMWLLSFDRLEGEPVDSNTLRYVEMGERDGFHRRHLTRKRKVWYTCERRMPAPILFTYMSRRNPRFIFNKAGIVALNTFHMVYPSEELIIDRFGLEAFLACLNSSRVYNSLRTVGRFYGGGLLKVEPKELEQVSVLDLRRLKERDREILANLFRRLCSSSRKCKPSEVRKELDSFISRLNL